MNRFDELDIESGFVLPQRVAVEFLDYIAQQHTKMVMDGEEDYEGMDAVLDDLYHMKKEIIDRDYHYIKFVECPMGASNMNIIEMVEKGE